MALAGLLAPGRPITAAPAGPRDPAGGRPAWRVVVNRGGMQELGAATLLAAGLDPASASTLQLWRDGAPVALEQRGAGASLALRFFAAEPGDRWNTTDTYWLTREVTPGLRMARRSVAPGAAPLSNTALERGHWREPATYDPQRPGPAGDHWFSADLRTGPGLPAATLPITLTPDLAPATDPMTLTLRGEAVTPGAHALDVRVGKVTQQVRWTGGGVFTHTLAFAAGADQITIALLPGAAPDQILVADALWERHAILATASSYATFGGFEEAARYRLEPLARGGASLYDVGDPEHPEILTDAVDGVFEDSGGRSYVMTTPDAVRQPAMAPYEGLALPTPGNAIYIVHGSLREALAPLVAHRRAAGHSVAVVDVQTLYDAWSSGQVDPEAIRAFLQYAAATWQPRPVAVTLVGDGTLDPFNYLGTDNANLVPPYLAPVDPWISETACEPCYGMLDGASPLGDDELDLMVGRLPVKSAQDLARVVGRIIAYETELGGLGWRSRAVLVADNAREAGGEPDPAGDFGRFADEAAAQLPAGVQAQKVYYDPWRGGAAAPWRIADAKVARERVRAALTAGAGLVVYAGHASHWEWAYTGPPLPSGERYLLGLYDPDTLGNGSRLPIVLAMTCLTSGFHQPAFGGSVLDERLVLSEQGGALAVWGPTGLGVAHGHEALLRGFMAALRANPGRATLGELTLAGYAALREDGRDGKTGNLSALRTYALLGDPLTPARVLGVERAFLPQAQK